MRRVAILGNAGSGKTTLARALAAEAGAVLLDADALVWAPGTPAQPRASAAAVAAVRAFCAAHESWVVEGCYGDLIEAALGPEVELVFLDCPEGTCLTRCRGRAWEPDKWPSPGAQDERLDCLLEWVRGYYRREGVLSRAGHAALFARHSGPKRRVE